MKKFEGTSGNGHIRDLSYSSKHEYCNLWGVRYGSRWGYGHSFGEDNGYGFGRYPNFMIILN